jgi:hypothetical protein
MSLNFHCWPEPPVHGAAATQPLSRVVRTMLAVASTRTQMLRKSTVHRCIRYNVVCAGGKQRSSSTEIIPDGKLLSILAT